MINPLDEIPEYLEEEVRNRIGAGADGSTLIVDESREEVILAYTGFTRALKREYDNACDERREDVIKVYQITRENSGAEVTRYESGSGEKVEKIWGEDVQ